jgi:hypothetical protein
MEIWRTTSHYHGTLKRPPKPITSLFDPDKNNSPTPGQLALALANLEGERHQQILPIENMAYAAKRPLYCPNLSVSLAVNKQICQWVQLSILDLELDRRPQDPRKELEKRSQIKRYFVQTAKVIRRPNSQHIVIFIYLRIQACKANRNFSSLSAIMTALQSDAVASLNLTHDYMPSTERQEYKKLADFLRPDSNYRDYRRALERCDLSGCIPCLGTLSCQPPLFCVLMLLQ